MRNSGCVATAAVALLLFPAVAVAGWSAPRRVSAPAHAFGAVAVAVNARGQSVIAWAPSHQTRTGPKYGTFVTVVTRTARGHVRARRVWSNKDAVVSNLSVAIDDRGVTTVAWAYSGRDNRHVPKPIRAAYGPLSGRWAAARIVGRATPLGDLPSGRYPHLAVAPSGQVLLAWGDDKTPRASLRVAWRERGHRFGRPRTVGRVPNAPVGAVPAFDTHGRAYLSDPCDGLILSAPPRSHRFRTTPMLATPGPQHRVLGMSLSLAGAGRGLASWVDGACSSGAEAGPTPGRVYASVLRGYRFGPPMAISDNPSSYGSTAVAGTGGGGSVSWSDDSYRLPFLGGFTAGSSSRTIAVDGSAGPVQQVPNALVPVKTDGGGDQILNNWGAPASAPRVVIVRRRDGRPDQQAPSGSGVLAVAAPVGRAAALVWNTNPTGGGPRLAISVWRP